MIFISFVRITKYKKVSLPGIISKDIKPIGVLLKPSNLLVPMYLVSILAQISDNVKDILNVKDIQNLYSVKAYRKTIFSGPNSVMLSTINSISKTAL